MGQTDTKEAYITKIIEMTGVSRSTIFRYLAGNQVRESSQRKIEDAMKILDGKQTPQKQTDFEIVVSINSSEFDIFKGNSQVLSGILERVSRYGIKMSLESNVDPKMKRSDRVGFIIVGKHGRQQLDEIMQIMSLDMPCVVVNRMLPDPEVSYVAIDNRGCGREMAFHLIDQGCRNIATWGECESHVAHEKFLGYLDALQERGIPCREELVEHDVEHHSLEESFRTFMAQDPKPDAFMALDDETAIRVMRLAREQGYRVPEDLAVSGMNDLGSSRTIMPSLTSIWIDFKTLGRTAVDIVMDLKDNPARETEKILVRHKLLFRESTRRRS
jgi:LacI family transcriptional regulator